MRNIFLSFRIILIALCMPFVCLSVWVSGVVAADLAPPSLDDVQMGMPGNADKKPSQQSSQGVPISYASSFAQSSGGVGVQSQTGSVAAQQPIGQAVYDNKSPPPQMSAAMGGVQAGSKTSNDFKGIYGNGVKIKNKTPTIPSLEARIGDWYVMSEVDNNGRKKCYSVIYPYDSVGNHKTKRKPYFMMVLTKKRISMFMATGYEFAKGSKLFVSLDGNQFIFGTRLYIAEPQGFTMEQEFVKILFQSSGIAAYGRSVVGTYSVDSYSLERFIDAYKKMIDVCVS